MRLLDVNIQCYGHFTDLPLSFEGDGVQVVLGPNEAGKSTLLEFVRELLFGFAQTTPYDLHKGKIAGAATLRLASGQVLELYRHKGRKNTVALKSDGRDIKDPDAFNGFLGGANANLFRAVFAFGLKELAAAEQGLGHESVRTALYSGGLANVVNPKQLLDLFKNESEKLFKKDGRTKPLINDQCGQIAALVKQVKEKSVRSEAYEQRREELKLAQERTRNLGEEWTALRREHSLTNKLVRAQPLWLQLNSLRREHEGLIVPDSFPAGGKTQYEAVHAEISRLVDECAVLAQEIEQENQEKDKVEFDPSLIEQRAAIEHVQKMIQSVKDARRDLPLRENEREATLRMVENELAELVGQWSLEDLREFRIAAATKNALEKLVEERQLLREEQRELTTHQKNLDDNVRNTTVELAALGEPVDTSALSAALAEQTEYSGNKNESVRLQREQARVAREIAALLPRLNPPLTVTVEKVQLLPVPPRETVAQFKRDFISQQRRDDAAEQSLAEEEAHVAALEKELSLLHGGRAEIPTRDGLGRLRAHRDAGWNLIRGKYIKGEEVNEAIGAWLDSAPRALPDLYEESVRESDRYADLLFDKSSAVAKQQQVEAAQRLVETKRKALASHRAASADLRRRWQDLWRPCGFLPLEPDAMEAWIEIHRAINQKVENRDHLAAEAQAVGQRLTAFQAKLQTALGVPKGDCATLLAMASAQAETARDKEKNRKTLEKSRRSFQEQATDLDRKWSHHRDREQVWHGRWQALMKQLGLPIDWTPDLAHNVIARLSTARVSLEKVREYEGRIGSMKERLAEFDPFVREICAGVAPDLLNKPPEVAAATLQERLTPAVTAQERYASLVKNLAARHKKQRDLERQLCLARGRHAALLASALASDDAEFRQVAERACRAEELDVEIAAKQREFELIRENEEPTSFVARLQDADLELLKERMRDLEKNLEETKNRKTTADEQVGSNRNALAEFEKGGGEAARYQEEVAERRAKIAGAVDRYVPLLFAQHLLREAIQRFEHNSQPEMLREVSGIFHSMTGGRYVRVERQPDDECPLLAYRDDGETLEPHQLSTGTREQLYLAIRFAYVLHYCKRAEPLPIVMDDVLANFDDVRARQTFLALGEVARTVQVIMFTCHPHLVKLARDVFPELRPVEITPSGCLESAGRV